MDADLSHPPEDLPALVAACDRADVAIGSRRVPGGRVVGRPAWRIALTAGRVHLGADRAGPADARLHQRLPLHPH